MYFFAYCTSTGQKTIFINFYKDKLNRQAENPNIPKMKYEDMILEISKASGVGQRTISKTLSKKKRQGTVISPN